MKVRLIILILILTLISSFLGLSLQDILTEVHMYVHRLVLPNNVKIMLLMKMAELESRLMAGSSEKIQLGGFLAAFQKTREMIKVEEEKMES